MPSVDKAPDEPQQLAYEQAKGRLQRQVDRLHEVRSTTNFLIAATALVASFLGDKALQPSGAGKALKPSDIGLLEYLALGALALGVFCGIRALMAIKDHEPANVAGHPASRIPEEHLPLVKWARVRFGRPSPRAMSRPGWNPSLCGARA
jgi:hypothetical protein